jgi:hypothetical protein
MQRGAFWLRVAAGTCCIVPAEPNQAFASEPEFGEF